MVGEDERLSNMSDQIANLTVLLQHAKDDNILLRCEIAHANGKTQAYRDMVIMLAHKDDETDG